MSVLGVWMWPESVASHGAARAVDRCVRMGVTDVYFLTKGLAGTAAYHSALAPRAHPRDLLRELLDAAHRRNVRVHAWLTSAGDEHYKALRPESGRCHYVRGRDKGLISLTDEGYLDYMRRIVRELCRGYDVDGLHLDYIRYNHLLYGWDDADLARYAAAGADIARLRELVERTFLRGDAGDENAVFDALRQGDASAQALARTRRADVVRFAKALTAEARAERGDLTLSAALMPEGAYADTAFADLHYGQNYEDAAALYDRVLPMAYSQAYDKDARWVREVAEGSLRRGLRTVMGLHAYEGGTGATLREDIAALEGAPVDGICLFREGAFAMAFADGDGLTLYNPLDRSVTAVVAGGERFPTDVPPGEEKRLRLPGAPEGLRAFAGEEEICVYPASAARS